MIAQTVQFTGISPETLYTTYLSSREHSAMTAGSGPACYFRPEVGEVAHGQEGDELKAFGEAGPDGQPHFSLHARIVQLVPGRLIVLAWKNMVWNYALDPSEITDLDSTVVLTFKQNLAGAEIQRCRRPMFLITKYVFLRQAKSAHSVQSSTRDFYLLYWEPMRAYFQKSEVNA